MVDGTALWNEKITGDMTETETTGDLIKIFPDLPSNLYVSLKMTASRYPEKTALVDDNGKKYSYGAFLKKCEEFAAYLYKQRKIIQGTHVGIMMHNSVEYCVAFYALSKIGAVVVSLPGKFKKVEVMALAEMADMEFLICEDEYAGWFEDIFGRPEMIISETDAGKYGYEHLLARWVKETENAQYPEEAPIPAADAPALMMFTSGTTSRSKAVLLKNAHIMHAVEVYRRILQVTEKDVSVIATPIYHITGLVALMGLFLSAGGTLYLYRKFDAKRLINDARRYKFTFLHASPTVFHLILQEGEGTAEIPSLRLMACGSSNMAKDKIVRLHRWLPHMEFRTVYGLTETSSPASIFPSDAAQSSHIGSSGWPVPGVQFKIVDEQNRELSAGMAGEVAVRGRCVLDGYYGQCADELPEGWLHTGDIGYFDSQNYLYIVDRKKSMINRGGEKIWCYDVENEIESIPGVHNAAVVGIEDEVYGEVAAAAVELERGSVLSISEIYEYLSRRMAKYKVPVRIKIMETIPQTTNGKPDKETVKKKIMED